MLQYSTPTPEDRPTEALEQELVSLYKQERDHNNDIRMAMNRKRPITDAIERIQWELARRREDTEAAHA